MAWIKGITVTLYNQTVMGYDDFGAPIVTENAVPVNNVLVYPATNTDIITATDLYGKTCQYMLCIPKGDTHTWKDRKVSFFGQTFHTFGMGKRYIEENIPLDWNEQWMVESYE